MWMSLSVVVRGSVGHRAAFLCHREVLVERKYIDFLVSSSVAGGKAGGRGGHQKMLWPGGGVPGAAR